MDNKNNLRFLSLALLAALLASSFALALGVTAPYWDERPLVMNPGDERTIQFLLQNMVGEDDATIRVALIEGETYASLVDSSLDYEVPFGEQDIPVNLKISVPVDATIGDTYRIGVSFTTLGNNEAGQFRLGSAFEKYFDVVVGQVPEPVEEVAPSAESNSSMVWYLLAGIALVVIIIWLARRKN